VSIGSVAAEYTKPEVRAEQMCNGTPSTYGE